MKSVLAKTLFTTATLLFFTSFAFGQSASWRLVRHPFDFDKAGTEISALCNEGYLPVGMEIDEGRSIFIFYVEDESMPFNEWTIHQFNDLSKLETEFTSRLKDGWVPMDISKTPLAFYTFFVKTDIVKIGGWRLATSGLENDQIEERINEFASQGFSPWGLSISQGLIWHLLINDGLGDHRSTFINSYKNKYENLKQEINNDIAEGWAPWGLMMIGEEVFVEYTLVTPEEAEKLREEKEEN